MNLENHHRLIFEAEDNLRTAYQRDRDRIIHCRAFRRLKHKTQVFVSPENDHPRTRLTHTIEVAQIARTIAYALGANENLTEAIALAHDLGHPPFGHAGEDVLNDFLKAKQDPAQSHYFDHNVQTLRIINRLENRVPEFDGLNLTKAVVEGTLKHSFPVKENFANNPYIKKLCAAYEIDIHKTPMVEAQIAGIADDIAYNHHDMDDGLRVKLFTLETACTALPFMQIVLGNIAPRFENSDDSNLMHHMVISKLIGETVTDFVENATLIMAQNPASAPMEDHHYLKFSDAMVKKQNRQKEFLFANMYRHKNVVKENSLGEDMLKNLLEIFNDEPKNLSEKWQMKIANNPAKKLRIIADYVAGMTDGFAQTQYQKLTQIS